MRAGILIQKKDRGTDEKPNNDIISKVISSTEENSKEVLTLVTQQLAKAKDAKAEGPNTTLLKIAHAYLSKETGKDLLRNPKKLNQYADVDQDQFLALMLLGRSCSTSNRRQAIIHYTRALLLITDKKRGGSEGLSESQIQSLKYEAENYLVAWSRKLNKSNDQKEQDYALMAKWAIDIIYHPSTDKLLKANPHLKTANILMLASHNQFPNGFKQEERAVIREHLETGLQNAFGHGFPRVPDSYERRLLGTLSSNKDIPAQSTDASQPSSLEGEQHRLFKRNQPLGERGQRLKELRQEQSSTPKVEPVAKPGQPGKP